MGPHPGPAGKEAAQESVANAGGAPVDEKCWWAKRLTGKRVPGAEVADLSAKSAHPPG